MLTSSGEKGDERWKMQSKKRFLDAAYERASNTLGKKEGRGENVHRGTTRPLSIPGGAPPVTL